MASGAPAAPAVQTVVLRVSIHCHGCKKKVRKVLKSIEGVQNVTVDASQHKVTVTGTVDANTLVQRLHKSGKKGVPWNCHEPANKTEAAAPAPAEKKPAGDGGKDVAAAPATADKKPQEVAVKEVKAESAEKKKPEPEKKAEEKKAEEKVEAKKAEEKVEAKKAEEKVEAKKDAEPKAKGAEPPAKEKVEAKKTEEKVEAKKDAEPPAKEEAKAEAAAAKDKDEAKKTEKPKDAVKPEPVAVTSERSLSMPAPAAPPKHAYYEEDYGYRHPYNNYAPAPQPVMSYHAAQPSASVSYYAPQPQAAYSMQQQPPPEYSSYQQETQQGMRQWSPSYLYMPYPHATPEPYHHDYYSPPGMHAPPPMPMQDSYRIFDDENPNSCSVM